jgi:hypothetical protein
LQLQNRLHLFCFVSFILFVNNQGFGISDVGLDVVMREHYSGTVPEWNAPHWTQPIPFEGERTRELDQRYLLQRICM